MQVAAVRFAQFDVAPVCASVVDIEEAQRGLIRGSMALHELALEDLTEQNIRQMRMLFVQFRTDLEYAEANFQEPPA